MARLFADFYARDTLTAARELVGCCLVRELMIYLAPDALMAATHLAASNLEG